MSRVKKIGALVLSAAMAFALFSPYSIKAEGSGEVTNNDASTYAYDIVKPVLEKVEFPANGTTVKVGDKLPVYVYAYDVDSGINSVMIDATYSNEELNLYDYEYFSLEYNDGTKRYEGFIDVIDGGYTSLELSGLNITDNAGNYYKDDLVDENGNYIYKGTIEGGIAGETSGEIQSLIFKQNKQNINPFSYIDFDVITDEKSAKKVSSLDLYFRNEKGNTVNYRIEKDGNSHFSTNFSKIQVNSNCTVGKYVLDEIYGNTESGNLVSYSFNNMENYWYILNEKSDAIKPIVQSIEMTHNQEVVEPGDVIEIKIKVSDNVALSKYGTMYIVPAASIDGFSELVDLVYDESANEYRGTLKITEKTYPCEWFISSIYIEDTSENRADTEDLKLEENYYVFVNNDGTFVNPTYNVDVAFNVLNKDGEYEQVYFENLKIKRRSTLKDAGVKAPDGNTSYAGLKFIEWVDYEGKPFSLDDPILEENFINLYAKYDKKVVKTGFMYPTVDMKLGERNEAYLLSNEATYKELLEKVNNNNYEEGIADFYKIGFEDWEYRYFVDDFNQVIPITNYGVDLGAVYKDKTPVIKNYQYYDVEGRIPTVQEVELVNVGTSPIEIKRNLEKTEVPSLYNGLRFKNWYVYSAALGEEKVSNYDYFVADAQYENRMVRFIIDDMFKDNGAWAGSEEPDWDYVKAIVAEEGETITVPKAEGYTSVKYMPLNDGTTVKEGDKITVGKKNINVYGYGERINVPEEPEEPENPEKPNPPIEKPEPPKDSSGKELPSDVIKETVSAINQAKNGETIKVDMAGSTVVPKEILEAAKGKDIAIELNMGGYTWTINGKDILSNSLKDINLEVKFNTANIPDYVIDDLAKGNPVQQISLTHNGDFGFKADLSFNIGKEYAGKYGNLYYYDSDGKMVFMNAGFIDENGNVSLSFSHASEYAIIINDKVMQEQVQSSNGVNTGTTNNTYMFMFMLIIASGIAGVALLKKEH